MFWWNSTYFNIFWVTNKWNCGVASKKVRSSILVTFVKKSYALIIGYNRRKHKQLYRKEQTVSSQLQLLAILLMSMNRNWLNVRKFLFWPFLKQGYFD